MKSAGQKRPAYFLYQALWSALDWVFPPTCGGCGLVGIRWCADCQGQICRITEQICSICGDMLSASEASAKTGQPICSSCLNRPPSYEALRSFGIFQGRLRKAMHRLKYEKDIGLGDPLSKHLIELYNQLKWDIDFIAPVPLSAKRLRERGYNQAGMLGKPLAFAVQKPYRPGILWRNRNTRSQVELSAQERQQNVKGAFTARADWVKGKAILVIDDVTTTGSTINACAEALRDAGASAVFGLTLARAASQADADDQPTTSPTYGGIYGSRSRDLS